MTDDCIFNLIEEHQEQNAELTVKALREGLVWKERYFKVLERCENLLGHESEDAIEEVIGTLETLFRNECR